MKKLLISVALVATALSVNAQKFKIGLGGAFNSTWLMNKNVFDANDQLDVAMSWGGSFGLKTQYYFNEKVGLELGIMSSGHNQKYDLNDGNDELTLKLRYMDVPLLLRVGGDKGGYFEFGPQFSFLSSAKDVNSDDDSKNVKGTLNSMNVGIAIGFGADVDLSESFTLTAGMRIGYGFSDVTKKYSNTIDLAQDADKMAGATYWAQFKEADATQGFKYKSTNRLWGGIHLGILYTLPTGK